MSETKVILEGVTRIIDFDDSKYVITQDESVTRLDIFYKNIEHYHTTFKGGDPDIFEMFREIKAAVIADRGYIRATV